MCRMLKSNQRYFFVLLTLALMLCSSKIIFSHVFLALSLTVPGLGSGLNGALFGGVGIFWSMVAGVASLGAGVVVGC